MLKKIIIIFCGLFLLLQCKEDETVSGADKQLFDEANNAAGFRYYRNDSTRFSSAANIPHRPFFRVRFNEIALQVLGPDGKLPQDSIFPKGSVIVNELYSHDNSDVDMIVVMKKSAENSNSKGGWIWGEYTSDGRVTFSVEQKGASCIGCHSSLPNRDLIKVFDLY